MAPMDSGNSKERNETHRRFRDLVRQYLNAQANGQILFVRQAGELLDRGLTLQRNATIT